MAQIERAILYTRVSTGEQAENGTSLAGQLEVCRQKAISLGAVIADAYEDAGVSGALYRSRPGLQLALGALERGNANLLIIANLSRYSRDREHQSTIKKRVEAAGGRLVFCDMDFADTPEGDLAFGILGNFADYERKVIKDRTTKGRRRRAQQGIQPGRNHSPFGYYVPTSKDVLSGTHPPEALGKYLVIENQAKLVREMFRRVADGDSVRSVARWLTHAGVPTPRGAVFWNCGTLHRLLEHPVYKGQATYGRFERRHDESRAQRGLKTGYKLVERPPEQWISIEAPALVDEATWDACQQKMKSNQGTLSGRTDRKHILSGLMRCPDCGQKMRAHRKRHNPKNEDSAFYNLYECRYARPATNVGGRACHNKQYRGYWAEPLVTRALQEVARRPEMAVAAVEAYRQAQSSAQTQPDIEQLEMQLADLQKQECATIKSQIAGVMAGADGTVYESMLRDLAAKRNHIVAVLGRAGHRKKTSGAGDRGTDEAAMVTQAIAAVDEVFNAPDDGLTPAEKQGLLAKVIEAIYPDGKEGLKIDLKPAFAFNQSVAYFTT